MYLLDTNHITLLERGGAAAQRLEQRLSSVPAAEIWVSVISYEEQIRGWMAAIARAKGGPAQVPLYSRLQVQLENYCNLSVLPFDLVAAARFDDLRSHHRRISAPDLKIAAIALSHGAVLLTQNAQDFRDIRGLRLDDWST